ncbi:MAG: alanyl-tRNA editing protein [Deltaproteobacteria bacterium]|nr:alanyl-tRNA editing protein [Deltaproteobacteria bacterium]
MTERLYLSDPYLRRFEAEVLRTRAWQGRTGVVLSRTAFYPEGGGQPADRGTLGGAAVEDVQEVEGEVLHLVAGPGLAGSVAGEIDWARRLDHIQQHHGQHLLSAVFEKRLGARTVSFHLGEASCTIDLDLPAAKLGPERLREAEAACNELVFSDLPVVARELPPEELARLPLRKEAVKGSRVVLVGDPGAPVDASPCGGTHPRRTGEVGAVAVLRAQRWGEGARVEFLCGGRVVAALGAAGERLARAAAALRCAPAEVAEAAARAADESARARKDAERLLAALAEAEAAGLAAGPDGPVVAEVTVPAGPAAGWLRALASALAARGRVAVLGAREGDRAQLCFARPRGPGPSAGEALRAAAAHLGGKGGGSPDLAQGSGAAAGLAEALALGAARMRQG